MGNIADYMNGLYLQNMEMLGLSNIREIKGIKKLERPLAHYTKMEESFNRKDTMTGHWEIMGLFIETPFLTFPKGFPKELIKEIEMKTGRKVIGNKPSSGTSIIEEFGKEHMDTGALIVYTSADSVLQICAHEEIIPIDEFFRICETVRQITNVDKYKVGRVIAGNFQNET